MDNNISIICLNCFGIPVPVNKKVRFELIARELHNFSSDIIALQEVFVWNNRDTLVDMLSGEYDVYPYKFYPFSSGGLVTFIKKDIKVKSFSFSKFNDQGNNTLLSIPDGIAGKGYQIFELIKNNVRINFVNCHMLCQYNRNAKLVNSYLNQIQELTKVLSSRKDYLILTGDLNDHPNSVGISYLKNKLKLYENLDLDSFTVNERNLNRGKIMNMFSDGKSYRTDYTFLSKSLKMISQKIIFDTVIKYNEKDYNLSDHYGVYTELEINK